MEPARLIYKIKTRTQWGKKPSISKRKIFRLRKTYKQSFYLKTNNYWRFLSNLTNSGRNRVM